MKDKRHHYECFQNGFLMQISTFDQKLSRTALADFKKLYRQAWKLDKKTKIKIRRIKLTATPISR